MFDYFVTQSSYQDCPFTNTGWGNGYVKIPPGHWLYRVHYDVISSLLNYQIELTYSDLQGRFWIIGFDTIHNSRLHSWSQNDVENATERLSQQLFDLKKPDLPEDDLNSIEHCEVCGEEEGACYC